MNFDGVLFFPVTPFTPDGTIDARSARRARRLAASSFGAGGVFPACGTGEFHALSASTRSHRGHAHGDGGRRRSVCP